MKSTNLLTIQFFGVFTCFAFLFWLLFSQSPIQQSSCEFGLMTRQRSFAVSVAEKSVSLTFPRLEIAIVIPFVWSQMNLLKANLASWTKFHPCIATFGDLVFYPSQISKEHATLQEELMQLVGQSLAKSCFGNIYFVSALVRPERDVYGVGVLDQVYHLFNASMITLKKNYNYIFYMEPDSRPIQNGWLDAIFVEATKSHPFWTKGSPPRYIYDQQSGDVPHINGNALYRFDSLEMKNHFLESRGAFQKYASFDQSWAVYLASKSLLHNYVYSDFILNNPSFDSKEFSQNTVLVHGKTFAKELEKLLGTNSNIDTKPIDHHLNKDIG